VVGAGIEAESSVVESAGFDGRGGLGRVEGVRAGQGRSGQGRAGRLFVWRLYKWNMCLRCGYNAVRNAAVGGLRCYRYPSLLMTVRMGFGTG
jgi:hypothetical protein